MTLLGLVNDVLRRTTGYVVGHAVDDHTSDRWGPLWHGEHVRGSWFVVAAKPYYGWAPNRTPQLSEVLREALKGWFERASEDEIKRIVELTEYLPR